MHAFRAFTQIKPGLFLVLVTSFFILNGCRVALIPDYNAAIAEQIEATAKEVDKFYLQMLETTDDGSEGRLFEKSAEAYITIEVELNSLVRKNKVRSLNEHSVRICEITLQLWIKYKEEHKKDQKLSNGLIKLNRKTFSDLFFAMQVAEDAKKIIANPPQ